MSFATFIIIFVVIAIICVIVRVLCVLVSRKLPPEEPRQCNQRRVIRRIRIDPVTNTATDVPNRQANTLAEETARDNRFNDIFFIEPNSAEAARIRAQLEKDDKDLPSYDEVMRMTDLATPTAATATNSAFVPAISASSHSIAASSTSVNTTDTTLTVPPYTETGAIVSSTSSIPRPLTPPPYSPEPPAANCVVLPITTPLHATTTQSS